MKTAKSATRTRRASIKPRAASSCRGCKALGESSRAKVRRLSSDKSRGTPARPPFYMLGNAAERIALLAPGVQPTLERPNFLNALLPQEQRHTGTGGFVGSSTVEDHFAVARQPVVSLL